jgi:putative ABC transport system permease protein
VAFLVSSFATDRILDGLSRSDDVHTQAVLERAGVFARGTPAALVRADRSRWLMILSGLLCFFGITNTILMSVNERVGEIGTLKCLGALDRFVVRLILIESAFVGLTASIAGTAAGYLLAVLQVMWTVEASVLSPRVCLEPLWIGAPTAVMAGTILTLLAALYPTYVAARMAPAEAMRAEF